MLHTKDALTDSDSRFRFTPRSFHQPVWKKSHMKDIRSQSTIGTQGTARRWIVNSAHEMGHWYVMHMPPCTKNKSREVITLSQWKFMGSQGTQQLHSVREEAWCLLHRYPNYQCTCLTADSPWAFLGRKYAAGVCLSTISETQMPGLVCPQLAVALGNIPNLFLSVSLPLKYDLPLVEHVKGEHTAVPTQQCW